MQHRHNAGRGAGWPAVQYIFQETRDRISPARTSAGARSRLMADGIDLPANDQTESRTPPMMGVMVFGKAGIGRVEECAGETLRGGEGYW